MKEPQLCHQCLAASMMAPSGPHCLWTCSTIPSLHMKAGPSDQLLAEYRYSDGSSHLILNYIASVASVLFPTSLGQSERSQLACSERNWGNSLAQQPEREWILPTVHRLSLETDPRLEPQPIALWAFTGFPSNRNWGLEILEYPNCRAFCRKPGKSSSPLCSVLLVKQLPKSRLLSVPQIFLFMPSPSHWTQIWPTESRDRRWI